MRLLRAAGRLAWDLLVHCSFAYFDRAGQAAWERTESRWWPAEEPEAQEPEEEPWWTARATRQPNPGGPA